MDESKHIKGVTIVCKESDKYGSRKEAMYIVERNASNNDMVMLSLRSRFNPELEYYATLISGSDEMLISLFKQKSTRIKFFEKL